MEKKLNEELKTGDKVLVHGYNGKVVRVYGTMVDVEVGGVIDRYDIIFVERDNG